MKILELIEKYTLYTVIILTPIMVSGAFVNPYLTSKLIFLAVGLIVVLLIKVIKSVISGSLSYMGASFDFPVLLLALAYLLSAYFKTPNKPEAFFLPGTATFMLLGAITYLLVNQLKEEGKKHVIAALSISSALLSLASLLTVAGVWKSVSVFPAFVKDPSFSPIGGMLFSFIFLASVLPLTVSLVITEKDMVIKALCGTVAAISVFGVIISAIQSFSGSQAQYPSFGVSWVVATDSLKESPLMGMGPGNYVSAFNRFRPLSYNATDAWRVRFTSSRSILLTIMTEAGLLGMAGFLLLLFPTYKLIMSAAKDKKHLATVASLALVLALLLMLPGNPVLIVLMFILLALAATTHSYDFSFGSNHASQNSLGHKLPSIIVGIPVVLASIYVLFIGTKAVSAEFTYRKALEAISKNQANDGYNLMQKTINTHPYVDRYRISYAQLNLALANAISQKKELTDQERQTVTQLIQQSIREAKTAVVLNRQRSGNWELLAQVYRSVIPLAQNADVFAIQTLRQAIVLDPVNPDLRISLGGLLYARKNYADAKDAFNLAVATKPDLANAHFNLAYAYKELGDLDRAIAEMKGVMSLVDQNTKDYETAKKALEDFESKKKAATPAQGSETLTPPTGEQQPSLQPPIELTEEETPPQANEPEEATVSATATPLP